MLAMGSPDTTTAAGTTTNRPSGKPRGRLRAVLFALAAALVTVTLVRNIVPIARDAHRALTTPGRSVADSDLDPLSYFVSTRAISGARAIIPPHASYTLVVGKTRPPFSALAGPALGPLPGTLPEAFKLWLMPRRYVPLAKAQWVIAYDKPVSALGVKPAQVITLDADATIVRVAGR
jgi:hypothetical protein